MLSQSKNREANHLHQDPESHFHNSLAFMDKAKRGKESSAKGIRDPPEPGTWLPLNRSKASTEISWMVGEMD